MFVADVCSVGTRTRLQTRTCAHAYPLVLCVCIPHPTLPSQLIRHWEVKLEGSGAPIHLTLALRAPPARFWGEAITGQGPAMLADVLQGGSQRPPLAMSLGALAMGYFIETHIQSSSVQVGLGRPGTDRSQTHAAIPLMQNFGHSTAGAP